MEDKNEIEIAKILEEYPSLKGLPLMTLVGLQHELAKNVEDAPMRNAVMKLIKLLSLI